MPYDKFEEKHSVMTSKRIYFNKIHEDAKIPSYANQGDAGMDLTSIEDVFLSKGERKVIRTGLRVKIPQGSVGLICPRSGLAAKSGITVINSPGILDLSYRGELKIVIINESNTGYQIQKGDRVAQLVITPYINCEVLVTEEFETETERGAGGFGSSGK